MLISGHELQSWPFTEVGLWLPSPSIPGMMVPGTKFVQSSGYLSFLISGAYAETGRCNESGPEKSVLNS